MLFDACDAWGGLLDEECQIFPLMGEIGFNAAATVCDENAVIVFDRRLSTHVGYEGAQALIAHELGHHVCGHLDAKGDQLTPYEAEYEPDRFAGATMRLLGSPRDRALGYIDILSDHVSHTHPEIGSRVETIIEGWDSPVSALQCMLE